MHKSEEEESELKILKCYTKHGESLSGSNGIRTHNHLVHKGTRNHLVKLA